LTPQREHLIFAACRRPLLQAAPRGAARPLTSPEQKW